MIIPQDDRPDFDPDTCECEFDDIDIEETARQTMFEMINWGWEKER